jgi:uncharacterized membrane protein
MRVCVLILALALFAGYRACSRASHSAAPAVYGLSAPKSATANASETSSARIDFDKQVRPIFESRCTPCHFAGGTMYERLPFDRAQTIKTLGAKLFTRIKDEKEQSLIREFLKQQAEQSNDSP